MFAYVNILDQASMDIRVHHQNSFRIQIISILLRFPLFKILLKGGGGIDSPTLTLLWKHPNIC